MSSSFTWGQSAMRYLRMAQLASIDCDSDVFSVVVAKIRAASFNRGTHDIPMSRKSRY